MREVRSDTGDREHIMQDVLAENGSDRHTLEGEGGKESQDGRGNVEAWREGGLGWRTFRVVSFMAHGQGASRFRRRLGWL